jgi:hypothetical protein
MAKEIKLALVLSPASRATVSAMFWLIDFSLLDMPLRDSSKILFRDTAYGGDGWTA